jgi:hypothetical protein
MFLQAVYIKPATGFDQLIHSINCGSTTFPQALEIKPDQETSIHFVGLLNIKNLKTLNNHSY